MLEHWKTRFLEHMERHPGLSWETAEQRLSGDPQALETLRRMEASGGEPDTLGWTDDGRLLFCDCASESPAGRSFASGATAGSSPFTTARIPITPSGAGGAISSYR